MTRNDLNKLKGQLSAQKTKATDLDCIVSQILTLPYGQVKKVLTAEILAVLEKYGYGE